jgi:hypothetical protein
VRGLLAAAALIAAGALLTACRSTVPVRVAGPAAPDAVCQDVRYRGHFHSADPEQGRRSVRLLLRGCRDGGGPVVFEVRGRVGGAVLAGAAGGGRILLLFPRDRRAVRGPDAPAVWRRWAGLPVEERLLRQALKAESLIGRTRRVGPWQVSVMRGEKRELTVEARSRDGDLLTLRREEVEPVDHRPAWPRVPERFEVVSATDVEGVP